MRPQERWLLRAAVLDGAEGRSAWAAWRRAGGDLDTADPSVFAVLPRLYRNLEANAVEDPDLSRLRGVYRHAWVVNQQLLARAAPVIERLERDGISTLVLGGPARASHYGDVGARRIDRVHVLVAPDELHRAERLTSAGGAGTVLRAHAFGARSVDDDLWAHAVPAMIGTARTLVPATTEQLLVACVWGARDRTRRLTRILDAAVLLGGADRVDWPRLVRGAVRRDVALTVRGALQETGETAGALAPGPVLAELAAHGSARERFRLAFEGRRRWVR